MAKRDDWSWSVETLYACPCGALVAARRWRWIDTEARPELAATVHAAGPLVGACSRCRRPTSGGGVWLEVAPARGAATLVASADRRGDLIAALQAHLADVAARTEQAAAWLLQPTLAFAPPAVPWAEGEGEIALLAWPGASEVAPASAAGRDPEPVVARAAEPTRPSAVVMPGGEPGRVEGRETGAPETRRREGSGPVVTVVERRDPSGPAARAPEPAARAEVGADARAAARPGHRGTPGPSHESSLEDTFPGRRPPRARPEPEGHEPGRAGLAEGAGPSGQEEAGLPPPPARHGAGLVVAEGLSGQEPQDMSAGTGRRADGEPGPEHERSALRAAVNRALTSDSGTAWAKRDAADSSTNLRREASDSGSGLRRDASDSGSGLRREASDSGSGLRRDASEGGTTWPKRQAGEEAEAPRPPRAGRGQPAPPPPPPPRLGPDVQRAGLAGLTIEGGAVQVSAIVNEATARVWATAPVKIRPVHLRGLGYPLVGVRCVAEVGGDALVLDAVVDVGHPSTLEIFKQLTREFRVRLAIRGGDAAGAGRDLTAPELQRNAAACLESAQAQLGTGEFPPDAFRSAREVLAGRNAGQRLEPARVGLSEALIERCRESAGAAWAALERVDQASKKDNLARLLEVDGLPVETYEKIRSASLAAAVEFGLPAPARFWRRWLGSEQARDLGVFVQRLTAARTASIARGEDLQPEQVEAAWRGLLDLCQHKNLTPPPELSKALGLGKVATGRRASQPQIMVVEAPSPPEATARSQMRRRDVAARLRGRLSDAELRGVFGGLSELTEDDLVALLPQIAELGPRALPELVACLRAPQRQIRQAAAIVLEHLGDRKAEAPLVGMLADEPTAAWVDAARALGNLGPRVVGPLCSLLRGAPAGRKEAVGARVARALAELARAEGAEPGGSGRQTLENLLDVADPSVASAARRALATLGAVREEVDGEDAEAARRFARLATDAFAPELDAAADDELDEVEVEVGD